MKKIFVLLTMVILLLSGCAAFWPPPKVETYTEIIKDRDGKIISSKHTRHVVGRYNNDPETTKSWADADGTARSGIQKELNQSMVVNIPLIPKKNSNKRE